MLERERRERERPQERKKLQSVRDDRRGPLRIREAEEGSQSEIQSLLTPTRQLQRTREGDGDEKGES